MGWHFCTASFTFSTLISENPLILPSIRRVAACTDCHGQALDALETLEAEKTYSNGVVAIGFQFGNVSSSDAVRLQLVNIDDERIIFHVGTGIVDRHFEWDRGLPGEEARDDESE